jgi:outer membrane protein assembly factor BamB
MSAGTSYLTISRFDPDQEKSILITLDAHDGKIVWTHEFSRGFLFRTAQFDCKVFVAVEPDKDFESGQLLAFSIGDGKLVWSNRIAIDSNGHDFTPVGFGGQVLIWSGDVTHVKEFGSSGKIRLMAYNADNGKHEWEYFPETEEGSIFSQPVTAGRCIYFNDQHKIFCIRQN